MFHIALPSACMLLPHHRHPEFICDGELHLPTQPHPAQVRGV